MAKQVVAASGWSALVLMVEVVGGADTPFASYTPTNGSPAPIKVTTLAYPIAAFSVDDVANEALPICPVGVTADAIAGPYGAVARYATPGDPTSGTAFRNMDELCNAAFAEAMADWTAAQS